MKAGSIISKVKKATSAEAKTLSNLFGSASTSTPKKPQPFNPAAECVVASRKRKKKSAIKRERPSNVIVVMLNDFSSRIPKGKVRTKLASKGQIQTLRFTRSMSAQEVKNVIIRAFQVEKYFVLGYDPSGHSLVRCGNQDLTGEGAIDRNGGLYLCKRFKTVSV